ncbi:MAG: alpha/beta hydrolase [Candidatus Dormibacteraeota bacterium]|nr:alpha/beta hydrolase [Candidatus Dormibacteraeota bacterium]MBV9524423.1 alpha/beta hydrolase [Candidatus Dormibacteraeota bacterium]
MDADTAPLPAGLDPAARTVLDYIAHAEPRPLREVGAAQARIALDRGAVLDLPVPDTVTVRADTIAADGRAIPVRVYEPGNTARGTVLFFHGGGFTIGSLDSHERLCGRLAAQSGCTVVSVAYRLAPEHPFPAAVHDALAALVWVLPRLDTLGGAGSGLAVVGDSAGGNLAAVVAHNANADARRRLRLQVLLYPVTDMTADEERYPSMRENATGLFLTYDDMRWFHEQYAADAESPLTSPALAESLAGLPRALVITAEFDPLRDQGEHYAELMRAAGVDVTLRRYDGQIHGFLSMSALVPAARIAMDELAADVRAALA